MVFDWMLYSANLPTIINSNYELPEACASHIACSFGKPREMKLCVTGSVLAESDVSKGKTELC